MYEKGVFTHYVSILKNDLKFLNDMWDLGELLRHMLHLNFFYSPPNPNALLFVNTWNETVKELEPEIRKMFLCEQKLVIDIKMGANARTLEYEKLRLALIGDVEFVALEGYCNECKQFVAVRMAILQYYRRLAHAHNADRLAAKCPRCNAPHRPLRLPNIWRYYLWSRVGL